MELAYLGAQLMAEALGEKVRKGPTVEIGFREITPTDAGLDSPLRHVAGVPMMQWHGDTFDLPTTCAAMLASISPRCSHASNSMFSEWLAAFEPGLRKSIG